MKKRNIILVVIFLLILPLAAYFFYIYKMSESDVVENNKATTDAQTDSTMQQKTQLLGSAEETIDFDENVGNEPEEKPDELTEQQWFFITSVHKAFKKADVPIVFYGKVVDQNNNPVVGAVIKTSATYYAGFSLEKLMKDDYYKTYELNLITDNGGMFVVDGLKGRSLDIVISKEGYIVLKPEFHYIYDPLIQEPHQPDAENPIIFTLWKKGGGEELFTSKARVHVKQDDSSKTHTVDLFNEQIIPGVSDQGDIIVETYTDGGKYDERTGGIYYIDKFDWMVTISIPKGGFIETDDPYLYQASESGYQSTISFKSDANDPDWINRIRDENYYFIDKKGRYGSLKLSINAYKDGDVYVYFEDININPTGSRDLEPLADDG